MATACLGPNTSTGLSWQEKCCFLIARFNFPCFSMSQLPLTLPPTTHYCEEPGCISPIPWPVDMGAMEAIPPPSWSRPGPTACRASLVPSYHFPPILSLCQGGDETWLPQKGGSTQVGSSRLWAEEIVPVLSWLPESCLSHTAPGAPDPYFIVRASSQICYLFLPDPACIIIRGSYIHTYYFFEIKYFIYKKYNCFFLFGSWVHEQNNFVFLKILQPRSPMSSMKNSYSFNILTHNSKWH